MGQKTQRKITKLFGSLITDFYSWHDAFDGATNGGEVPPPIEFTTAFDQWLHDAQTMIDILDMDEEYQASELADIMAWTDWRDLQRAFNEDN